MTFFMGVAISSSMSGSLTYMMRQKNDLLHTSRGLTIVRTTHPVGEINTFLNNETASQNWDTVSKTTGKPWPSYYKANNISYDSQQNHQTFLKAVAILAICVVIVATITIAGFILLLHSRNCSIWKYDALTCSASRMTNQCEGRNLLGKSNSENSADTAV